jgi:trehalose 6-phosphate phosphatase
VPTVGEVASLVSPPDRAGLILDFDGTLSPIVVRPELARIWPPAAAELERLAGSYRLVAVLSGRPTSEIIRLVGVDDIRYEGLYGLGDVPQIPERVLAEVAAATDAIPGAGVEPKGATVSVHFRETADPEAAEAELATRLAALARSADLEVIRGKRVLELVPAGRRRKGGAVDRLVRESGLTAALYAGDDLADLEAFETLDRWAGEGVTTVKVAVAGWETPDELVRAADLVVEGPDGLAGLLRAL